MNDTSEAIERKYETVRRGEPENRGCSMHATAHALAKAWISQQHPGARPADLKRLLFLHFYGADFEPEERKRIASALAERGRADSEGETLLINSRIVGLSDAVRGSVGRCGKKGKKKGKRSRQDAR
jgi:hypothetical protein